MSHSQSLQRNFRDHSDNWSDEILGKYYFLLSQDRSCSLSEAIARYSEVSNMSLYIDLLLDTCYTCTSCSQLDRWSDNTQVQLIM